MILNYTKKSTGTNWTTVTKRTLSKQGLLGSVLTPRPLVGRKTSVLCRGPMCGPSLCSPAFFSPEGSGPHRCWVDNKDEYSCPFSRRLEPCPFCPQLKAYIGTHLEIMFKFHRASMQVQEWDNKAGRGKLVLRMAVLMDVFFKRCPVISYMRHVFRRIADGKESIEWTFLLNIKAIVIVCIFLSVI